MTPGARWSAPMHLTLGIVSTAFGLALIMLPLAVQQIAAITGAGIIIAGAILVLREKWSGDRAGRQQGAGTSPHPHVTTWVRWVPGSALIVVGAAMALWPDAGAPWLARAIALALILHGATSMFSTFRGSVDHRVSGILIALAGVALGVLSFSWPVLTLAVFRLGIGAWLILNGLHTILNVWRSRASHSRLRDERAVRKKWPRVAKWSRTIGSAVALVLAIGAAYGSAQLLGGTPLPAPDKFYTASDNVPSQHGQLIQAEPLKTGVPPGAEAWKMLYTTTQPDGSAAIASGTILAPSHRDGSELPLLTVSHGTTGVVDGCAPSLSATPFADGASAAMQEMVTEHGWVAVTSDYVGMGTEGTAAYLVGDAEARNVLDASLAARQFNELSIATDTVVWGHSQGGQGALWTAQIAEEYAPGLTVLGVGAFAPAADLFGLADADKKTAPGKTVSAYIASTWNSLYPELGLEQQLTPGSARPVERISQLCFNGSDALSAILLGTQIPNQVFPDSVLAGDFGKLLKQQTPTGPFPAPVLVAQGLADPLVMPKMQQQWVDDRCDAGVSIDYRTFVGRDHVSLVAADSPLSPQIVQWTLDRWNGKPAPTKCTSKKYAK